MGAFTERLSDVLPQLFLAVGVSGVLVASGFSAPWSSDKSDKEIAMEKEVRLQEISIAAPGAIIAVGLDGKEYALVAVSTEDEFIKVAKGEPDEPLKGMSVLPVSTGFDSIKDAYNNHEAALKKAGAITFEPRTAKLDADGKDAVSKVAVAAKSYPYKTEILAIADALVSKELTAERVEIILAELESQGAVREKFEVVYRATSETVNKRINLRSTLK